MLTSRRGSVPTERVRPGAYVRADEWAAAPGRERHLLKVRAAARSITDRAVYSHESAAAVHGIPILGEWPDVVRASHEGRDGMAARIGVQWSRARWEAGDVVIIAGLRVTSPRRTAVDLARTGALAQGVAALDFVLAGGADRELLEGWCATSRAHGIGRVRRSLSIARGMSESPLESLSLARFAELGVEAPLQQHEIDDAGRRFRVDFYWPRHDVVGEADGRSKYVDPTDLWNEKLREDAIRRRVRGFIRWTWADAWDPVRFRSRLASAGIPSV
jgi:hypothetical protein